MICNIKYFFPMFLTFSLCSGSFAQDKIILEGAGATFPQLLYMKWFKAYQKNTGVRINYSGIGSGGGIKQLLERKVDFGATDAFLEADEMEMRPEILHVPTCIGAVAVIYNLPGAPQLRFTPEVLSGILLGDILDWSDRRIKKCNPDIKLPKLKITLVHRSDSSGTTYLFSNYLSKVSKKWKEEVKFGKLIKWPVGIGVEGNPGVANFVRKIKGSLGYVELSYAIRQRLPVAELKNRSGKYIRPSLNSAAVAAERDLPDDCRALITDTDVEDGYPVSAFTYLIFYREQKYNDRLLKRAKALSDMLLWCVGDAQKFNSSVNYAPLPESAKRKAVKIIKSITYDGKLLFDNDAHKK